MERNSKHAAQDAKKRNHPRGFTKFCILNHKNKMMCDLCEVGYGKPYEKSSRQFHEESDQHQKLYKHYCECFGVLREEHLLWLEDSMKSSQLNRAHDRMQNLNYTLGLNVMDLLHMAGDPIPLKLALADMLLAKECGWTLACTRAHLAVHKHLYFSNVLLVHGIAKGILVENTDNAYTAAQLLIPYVCD